MNQKMALQSSPTKKGWVCGTSLGNGCVVILQDPLLRHSRRSSHPDKRRLFHVGATLTFFGSKDEKTKTLPNMEPWTQFTLLILGMFSFVQVSGLTCYVGLGNNSQRRSQKVVNCPEDRHYVCVKMYGGDMGDQIRRKCEKMSIPDYEELLEQEALKERMIQMGESWEVDPACHEDVHHGRDVHVCYCSIDQCNSAISTKASYDGMVQTLGFGLWIFRHKITL